MFNNPTVRRRRLGAELRTLREAAGLTVEQAAQALECSQPKISRIELGRVGIKMPELQVLLTKYKATQADIDRLADIARQSRIKGWWDTYPDVVRGAYVGLESAASTMRNYEPLLVPGLLQTADYSRAVLKSSDPTASEKELDRRVSARMTRQIRLNDYSLEIWIILEEAVLARPMGGHSVLENQLTFLLNTVKRPNTRIQILPTDIGSHPGLDGGFNILSFPEPGDHDVVYLEHLASDLYVEKMEDVRKYTRAFDDLRAAALSPEQSAELIDAAIKNPSRKKEN